MITATRYHDISVGHTVTGHESKCQHLHGHNYRIHFEIASKRLDEIGRVIDFGVIKSKLCNWLEENWDHRFLVNRKDPRSIELQKLDPQGVEVVDFNPTAENMAAFLGVDMGPFLLRGTECEIVSIIIEETRKCKATWKKD